MTAVERVLCCVAFLTNSYLAKPSCFKWPMCGIALSLFGSESCSRSLWESLGMSLARPCGDSLGVDRPECVFSCSETKVLWRLC